MYNSEYLRLPLGEKVMAGRIYGLGGLEPLSSQEKSNWNNATMLEVSGIKLVTHGRSLCLSCRGGKMLCGKSYCPILSKAEALIKHLREVKSMRVEGSSPPGIFVGRMGYPKVYAGPMIPPFKGDTSILDAPEEWVGKSFQEIIDYRYSLIRGKVRIAVDEAADPDEPLLTLQELS
ncbi:MAG: hypothetical protein ACP5QI_08255, partial [Candidatus Bathyarchaeia archaeon]